MIRDRLEQRGGQPPRPRRARRRPAPGHLQRLGAQLIRARHARTRQDGQPGTAADDPIRTTAAAPAPPAHTIPATHPDPGTRLRLVFANEPAERLTDLRARFDTALS
jgi:hypothetical protein